MESALTDPRKTEINEDFHVSTALFSARLETRLFSKIDEIPAELVKLITDAVNACIMLDRKFLALDTGYRYSDESEDDSEYACDCGCDEGYEDDSEPESYVSGISVETYGFADSQDIHEAMSKAVSEYITGRKRTVTYV